MINKNEENKEPLDLQSLQRTITPPAELEERVISDLRNRKLFASGFRHISLTRTAAVVAACLAFFVGGMLVQKSRVEPVSGVSMSDSTFVLFLLEGSEYVQPNDHQQQQERIAAYRNWAVDLRKRGIPITGTKLRDEKDILGTVRIRKTEEEISGYFLIDARDSKEAISIARKCPHLQYGGTIEIRRVHPV